MDELKNIFALRDISILFYLLGLALMWIVIYYSSIIIHRTYLFILTFYFKLIVLIKKKRNDIPSYEQIIDLYQKNEVVPDQMSSHIGKIISEFDYIISKAKLKHNNYLNIILNKNDLSYLAKTFFDNNILQLEQEYSLLLLSSNNPRSQLQGLLNIANTPYLNKNDLSKVFLYVFQKGNKHLTYTLIYLLKDIISSESDYLLFSPIIEKIKIEEDDDELNKVINSYSYSLKDA